MYLEVYAIKDEKVGAFLSPFFVKSLVEAMRSIKVVARDANSNLSRFPTEFSVHYLGRFDESKGVLEPSGPAFVVSIENLIKDGVQS